MSENRYPIAGVTAEVRLRDLTYEEATPLLESLSVQIGIVHTTRVTLAIGGGNLFWPLLQFVVHETGSVVVQAVIVKLVADMLSPAWHSVRENLVKISKRGQRGSPEPKGFQMVMGPAIFNFRFDGDPTPEGMDEQLVRAGDVIRVLSQVTTADAAPIRWGAIRYSYTWDNDNGSWRVDTWDQQNHTWRSELTTQRFTR